MKNMETCRIRGICSIVSMTCLVTFLPLICHADQNEHLKIGMIIQMASDVAPAVYVMIAAFIMLMAANAANIVAVWQLFPAQMRRELTAHLESSDYKAIQSFSDAEPKDVALKSLRAGIKKDETGRYHLDTAGVLSSFQTLIHKYRMLPLALKAFGTIVLLLSIWAVGEQMIRFYMELYDRMAVVVGNYPFRKIFQAGSARIMVLAIGGLSVAVASIISGFLFSGALRLLLTRKTAAMVEILSGAKAPRRLTSNS